MMTMVLGERRQLIFFQQHHGCCLPYLAVEFDILTQGYHLPNPRIVALHGWWACSINLLFIAGVLSAFCSLCSSSVCSAVGAFISCLHRFGLSRDTALLKYSSIVSGLELRCSYPPRAPDWRLEAFCSFWVKVLPATPPHCQLVWSCLFSQRFGFFHS